MECHKRRSAQLIASLLGRTRVASFAQVSEMREVKAPPSTRSQTAGVAAPTEFRHGFWAARQPTLATSQKGAIADGATR
jgi:hypothetical protein